MSESLAKATPRQPSGGKRPPIIFDYHLKFDDGGTKDFRIRLDPVTLQLLAPQTASHPAWTAIGFARCPNCTLDASTHPHCPVAVAMVDVVDGFKDSLSYHSVDVTVTTAQRQYSLRTSLQSALSSITGIYMTTAGCPIMDRMRPMVESHLPFASQEETIYRTVSMYLFAQFALARNNQQPDWTLDRLMAYLVEVGVVNTAFCGRLNQVPHLGDANVNALAILDSLASLTAITIEGGRLEKWEALMLRHWQLG